MPFTPIFMGYMDPLRGKFGAAGGGRGEHPRKPSEPRIACSKYKRRNLFRLLLPLPSKKSIRKAEKNPGGARRDRQPYGIGCPGARPNDRQTRRYTKLHRTKNRSEDAQCSPAEPKSNGTTPSVKKYRRPQEGAPIHLLRKEQTRASRRCQPSHERGWRTHA